MKTVLINVRQLDWSGFEPGTVRNLIVTVHSITWWAFIRVLELLGDKVMPSVWMWMASKVRRIDWLTTQWGSVSGEAESHWLTDWLTDYPVGQCFWRSRVTDLLTTQWGNVSGEAESHWLTDYPVGHCFWRSWESLADCLPNGTVFLDFPRNSVPFREPGSPVSFSQEPLGELHPELDETTACFTHTLS